MFRSAHSVFGLDFVKMMSISVDVKFLSRSLKSRKSLANLAPSMVGAALLSLPNAQKDVKTSPRVDMSG